MSVVRVLACLVLGAAVGSSQAGASSLSRDLELLFPFPGEVAGVEEGTGDGIGETNEIKLIAIGSIRMYRILFSSQSGKVCGFTPSCSRFTQEAIDRFGVAGLLLGSDRLQRCHWFELDHYSVDPVSGKRLDPVDAYAWGARSLALPRRTVPRPIAHGSSRAPTPPGPSDSGESTREGGQGFRPMRKFADHLASEGDWLRAATEYRRCSLAHPDLPASDTLSLLIGACLREGGETSRAVRVLEDALGRSGTGELDRIFAREIALAHYETEQSEEGVRFIEDLAVNEPDLFHECGGEHLLGVGAILRGDWVKANVMLSADPGGIDWPDQASAASLREIAADGMTTGRKSPVLAGTLSAIVPGSGKAYSNRFLDGIYSLITIGVAAWASVDGFSEDGVGSGRGWVYGTLSTGFYLGNVYGSVITARQYNESVDRDLRERTASVVAGRRFP